MFKVWIRDDGTMGTKLQKLVLATLAGITVTATLHTSAIAQSTIRVDGRALGQVEDAIGEPKTVKAEEVTQYREELRNITDALAQYAESRDPNFKLVGRNADKVMVTSPWEQQRTAIVDPDSLNRQQMPDDAPGGPIRRMLSDFDAIALDNQNCPVPPPPPNAPKPTKAELNKQAFHKRLLDVVRANGTTILSLDDCDKKVSFYKTAELGRKNGMTSIVVVGAPDAPKQLPHGRLPYENSANIDSFAKAQNGIWLRGPRAYPTKADWIVGMGKSNADILIIDAFYKSDQPLTKSEVNTLKFKYMGAKRILLAGLDLGTARDDRYYWKREWRLGSPSFLRQPSFETLSGIMVNYWDPEWKKIIGEYFKGLMDLGFDGILIQGLNAAEIPEAEALLE